MLEPSTRSAPPAALSLIAGRVEASVLRSAGASLTPVQYADVVCERALEGICGYPTCGKPPRRAMAARGESKSLDALAINVGLLGNASAVNNFCSALCCTASTFFYRQLSPVALPLRAKDGRCYAVELWEDPSTAIPSMQSDTLGTTTATTEPRGSSLRIVERFSATSDPQPPWAPPAECNALAVEGFVSRRRDGHTAVAAIDAHTLAPRRPGDLPPSSARHDVEVTTSKPRLPPGEGMIRLPSRRTAPKATIKAASLLSGVSRSTVAGVRINAAHDATPDVHGENAVAASEPPRRRLQPWHERGGSTGLGLYSEALQRSAAEGAAGDDAQLGVDIDDGGDDDAKVDPFIRNFQQPSNQRLLDVAAHANSAAALHAIKLSTTAPSDAATTAPDRQHIEEAAVRRPPTANPARNSGNVGPGRRDDYGDDDEDGDDDDTDNGGDVDDDEDDGEFGGIWLNRAPVELVKQISHVPRAVPGNDDSLSYRNSNAVLPRAGRDTPSSIAIGIGGITAIGLAYDAPESDDSEQDDGVDVGRNVAGRTGDGLTSANGGAVATRQPQSVDVQSQVEVTGDAARDVEGDSSVNPLNEVAAPIGSASAGASGPPRSVVDGRLTESVATMSAATAVSEPLSIQRHCGLGDFGVLTAAIAAWRTDATADLLAGRTAVSAKPSSSAASGGTVEAARKAYVEAGLLAGAALISKTTRSVGDKGTSVDGVWKDAGGVYDRQQMPPAGATTASAEVTAGVTSLTRARLSALAATFDYRRPAPSLSEVHWGLLAAVAISSLNDLLDGAHLSSRIDVHVDELPLFRDGPHILATLEDIDAPSVQLPAARNDDGGGGGRGCTMPQMPSEQGDALHRGRHKGLNDSVPVRPSPVQLALLQWTLVHGVDAPLPTMGTRSEFDTSDGKSTLRQTPVAAAGQPPAVMRSQQEQLALADADLVLAAQKLAGLTGVPQIQR